MLAGPTIELKVADGRRCYAAAVGAGPSGSLAARELTKLGLSVLLIHAAAFPRSKVCGCYLSGNRLEHSQCRWLGTASSSVQCCADQLPAIRCARPDGSHSTSRRHVAFP